MSHSQSYDYDSCPSLCTSKARCVNRKGLHAAKDAKCPVYAVNAKAAQDRFVGKVVAGLDDVTLKEAAFAVPGAAPCAPAPGADGRMPSYSAVVGKPDMLALVRTTGDGEKVVCYLPRPPSKKPPHVGAQRSRKLRSNRRQALPLSFTRTL